VFTTLCSKNFKCDIIWIIMEPICMLSFKFLLLTDTYTVNTLVSILSFFVAAAYAQLSASLPVCAFHLQHCQPVWFSSIIAVNKHIPLTCASSKNRWSGLNRESVGHLMSKEQNNQHKRNSIIMISCCVDSIPTFIRLIKC